MPSLRWTTPNLRRGRAPIAAELGEMIELTQEDEENIREKLTEAEVFVKYGLVDKAIAQLLDVLESFRFHVDSRAKLVEIYKEQNMAREASEQLMQLAQVYDQIGQSSDARQAREEATELNPALAAETASAELAAQEELELTLAPDTDSDLGDVGLELDAPSVGADIFSSPPLAEAPVAEEEEFAVVVEDEVVGEDFAVEVDLSDVAQSSTDVSLDSGDAIEMDLDASDVAEEEIQISLDDGLVEGDQAASAEELGDFSVSLSVDDEEDFSVELPEALADDDDDDDLVALPDTPSVDDIQVDVPLDVPSVDDIQIDIPADVPSVDDIHIDIPAVDETFVEEPEDIVAEIPAPPEEPVLEPRAAPSAPAPLPAAAGSPVAAELAEVDEYIALGLYEDARDTLRELLKQHPGDEAVVAKLEELGFSAKPTEPALSAAATVPSSELPKNIEVEQDLLAGALPDASHDGLDDMSLESLVDSPAPGSMDFPGGQGGPGGPRGVEEQFIDLASELSDEIFGTQAAVDDDDIEPVGPMTDPGIDQIFKGSARASKNSLEPRTTTHGTTSGLLIKRWALPTKPLRSSSSRPKTRSAGSNAAACWVCVSWRKACPTSPSSGSPRGWGFPVVASKSIKGSATTSPKPIKPRASLSARSSSTWKSTRTTLAFVTSRIGFVSFRQRESDALLRFGRPSCQGSARRGWASFLPGS